MFCSEQMPADTILHGDKGMTADAVRRKIESKGVAPNIPPKGNRRWKNWLSPYLYRDRKHRALFARIKLPQDRDAYDKLAQTSLPPSVSLQPSAYWL